MIHCIAPDLSWCVLVPLVASVIFGSQRVSHVITTDNHMLKSSHQDILLTWIFWRPRSTASDISSQPNLSSLAELSSVESVVIIGRSGWWLRVWKGVSSILTSRPGQWCQGPLLFASAHTIWLKLVRSLLDFIMSRRLLNYGLSLKA